MKFKFWESEAVTESDVEIKINEAIQELQSNGVEVTNGIRSRIAAAVSGGYDFADTLHNIYLDFGYPASLDFDNYWNMYRRFGIAKNVVELPVDTGWVSPPTIEGTPALEKEIDKLINDFKMWQRVKGLDKRQRVGRYAGMYMRVKDNKKPSEPLDGKLNGLASLVEMMPLYESQLKVTKSDNDPQSENYGNPILYQYSGSAEGDRNEQANNTLTIHASRIVIAAEDADAGWIYGISSLEAPYNSLMDLRKIIGAGGEGFYKNAAQNIVFKLTDAASATNNEKLLNKFNEHYDDFSHNRARRAMWTPGLEAQVLESSLMNPKEFFINALNDVAAGSKIPATILIGQQTGKLASTEDTTNFLSTIQSRRENFMTDLVSGVIDWMMNAGLLKPEEYEIIWDDLLARSDVEKLASAKDMAETNQKQFQSGQGVPFTPEEIREAAGFEPEEIEEPGGEEIDEDADIVE